MIYWIVGLMAFASFAILVATIDVAYYDDDDWGDD